MPTQPEPKTLGEFIQQQINMRPDTSVTQFAEAVGVTHTAMLKYQWHGIRTHYAGNPIGDPSARFLALLSNYTHVPITALYKLTFKDIAVTVDAEAEILAGQISALPADARARIEAEIIAMHVKSAQKQT